MALSITSISVTDQTPPPIQPGKGYTITNVVNGAELERQCYYKNQPFLSIATNGNGAITVRPHPGVDVNGQGGIWRPQPFYGGAEIRSQIVDISESTNGITLKASGPVPQGLGFSYGTWTNNLLFSYSPEQKKVSGNGTYSITLPGPLNNAVSDLTLYALEQNLLEQVPLLNGTTGDSGNMSIVNIKTENLISSGSWNPLVKHEHWPTDQSNYLSVETIGQHNTVDTAAQGYDAIAPAYKPTIKVALDSQQAGISMAFRGTFDSGYGRYYWINNMGTFPSLIRGINLPTNYNFNVEFESSAIAGDSNVKKVSLAVTNNGDVQPRYLSVFQAQKVDMPFTNRIGSLKQSATNSQVYTGDVFIQPGNSSFFKVQTPY